MTLERDMSEVIMKDYINDINNKKKPLNEAIGREQFAIEVAEYIIENNTSTRATASRFGISNATVYGLVMSLEHSKPEIYKDASIVLAAHSDRNNSAKNPVVKKRVLNMAVSYLTEEDSTIDSVATTYKVSYFTAYRDLTTRLPEINPDLAVEVAQRLAANSIGNRGKNVKKS